MYYNRVLCTFTGGGGALRLGLVFFEEVSPLTSVSAGERSGMRPAVRGVDSDLDDIIGEDTLTLCLFIPGLGSLQ